MGAYLVPSSGGDAIPLRKTRVYLGRSKDAAPDTPPGRETALILLELIEGWWFLEDLRSPTAVRVNGFPCKKQKLAPNDEIELGRHRYRINYETPKYRFGRKSDGEFQAVVISKNWSDKAARPAAPSGVLGRLVPLGGGADIPLRKTRLTVGRRAPCDVVIERSTVSSKHCELEFIEGYWFVRDLDSRNGIRVGGQRVTEGWILPNGRVTIGDQRYQLDYAATGPAPIGAVAARTDRSLMEQVGLGSGDLDRVVPREQDDDDPAGARKRWNVLEDS